MLVMREILVGETPRSYNKSLYRLDGGPPFGGPPAGGPPPVVGLHSEPQSPQFPSKLLLPPLFVVELVSPA